MSPRREDALGLKDWLRGPGEKSVKGKGDHNATPMDRIAILPLANISPDPRDEYFADGLTEELISTLSEVPSLRVISRTSVMRYKQTDRSVEEISKELNVGSILEGSVRKAADNLRITVKLIDVQKDEHVWSHSYDRNLDDVFAIQTDIARQVADALRAKILPPERDRIEKKPTDNTNAYSLYLRGRYHWNRRHLDDVRKAVDCFEQAVREDPSFALGHTGLADCFMVLGTNHRIDPKANHEKAKRESARAVELDKSLAEAHASLGGALMTYDLKGAENELRKAIDLKPGYATAHHWYCMLLRSQMRLKEAFDQIKKALELDPFSQVINANLAGCYFAAREYDKALEISKRTAELDPRSAEVHFFLRDLYGTLKRFDEAEMESNIALGLLGEGFPMRATMSNAIMAYFRGDKETVRRLLPDVEANIENPGFSACVIAGLHFFLGENDKGFDWLERSISRLEYEPLSMRYDSFFDGVRPDPRYLSLTRKLGLD